MEKIINVNSVKQTYKDEELYASYTTLHRVLPDYRDGLKPVQRKIMYTLFADEKAISKATKVKSSAVVGTVMKKYHPHGNTGIYGAMKPLANWFEINKPLITPWGNFGNIDGNPAAAERYTEVYMSKFGLDCVISDLQETKNAVDWTPTYDGRDLEPEFLPAAVPILLINGSFGIGVGIKVEIPRHNINEVIDATINLINNPNAPVVLVPDHCLPCEIIDTNFKEISNKGFGTYKVRGIIDIDTYQGKPALIIKSVPDITFLSSITKKIEDMIKSNKIIQIADVIDETPMGSKELRYIYVLKQGADPNFVRDMIYKNTDMEQNCRVNFEALDGIIPMRMSYKSYLQAFIEFRKMTKFRVYCNRLKQLRTRLHEIEPFIAIVKSGEIDAVIDIIRKQKDSVDGDDTKTIEKLIKLLYITDLQAKFILNSPIKRLSLGSLNRYCDEESRLREKIDYYYSRTINPDIILQDIIVELNDFKQKYGNPRRCKIISEDSISDIPQGEFKVVVTQANYLKKIPLDSPIGIYKGDLTKCVIKASNSDNIIIFDNKGKMFKLPVNKIAFTERNASGVDSRLLVKNLSANITTIIAENTIKEFSKLLEKCYLVTVTTQGYIKKMDLEDFLAVAPSGSQYIKLNNGDSVKDVRIMSDSVDLIVYSDTKALRFPMSEVPNLKRNTKGNMCMNTTHIDGISVITPDTSDIVVITAKGKANRFSPSALPRSTRRRAGNNVARLGKGDKLHTIYGVNSNDTIRIYTNEGYTDIKVSDIPIGSSVSSGTKVLSTKKANTINKCIILERN